MTDPRPHIPSTHRLSDEQIAMIRLMRQTSNDPWRVVVTTRRPILSPDVEPADPLPTLSHRSSIPGPDGRPLRPTRVRTVVAWTLAVAAAVTALVWGLGVMSLRPDRTAMREETATATLHDVRPPVTVTLSAAGLREVCGPVAASGGHVYVIQPEMAARVRAAADADAMLRRVREGRR